MTPRLLAVSDSLTWGLAILAVVGTILGVLVTQVFEGRRDSARHTAALRDEQEQWLRDRRADLYVRTTTLYFEFRGFLQKIDEGRMELATGQARSNALLAEADKHLGMLATLTTTEIASWSDTDREAWEAKESGVQAQREAELKQLAGDRDRLVADLNPLRAQFDDIYRQLRELRMPFQVFASSEVLTLANALNAELPKHRDYLPEGQETGSQPDSSLLDGRWNELHSAMRRDLKIPE